MLTRRILRRLPVPVRARHAEWSVVASADDLDLRPAYELVRLLANAAELALAIGLPELERRSTGDDRRFVATWPGEHYRLLPALASAIGAIHAVEVGTFRGHGALALLEGLPAEGALTTYDVVPWDRVPGSVLRPEDFGPRLQQRIADLSEARVAETELATLRRADLIFVDGPKDGIFEPAFVRGVLARLTDRRRLVVFDDIRLLPMVQLWRDLDYAKLDATSFGHWSGTGLLLTC